MTEEQIDFYNDIKRTADEIAPFNILNFIEVHYADGYTEAVDKFLDKVMDKADDLWYNIHQKPYKCINPSGNNPTYGVLDRGLIGVCALSEVCDEDFYDVIDIVIDSPYIKYIFDYLVHVDPDAREKYGFNNGVNLNIEIMWMNTLGFEVLNNEDKIENIYLDYIGGFDEMKFMWAINQKSGEFDYTRYSESFEVLDDIENLDYDETIIQRIIYFGKAIGDFVGDNLNCSDELKEMMRDEINDMLFPY